MTQSFDSDLGSEGPGVTDEQVFKLYGALGPASESAAKELVAILVSEPSLFPSHAVFGLPPSAAAYLGQLNRLGNIFQEPRWSDEAVAEVLQGITEYAREQGSLVPNTVADVQRWVRAHEPNDSRSVLDCLAADPPKGFVIHRVLSRAGSQKLVFRSTLIDGSREVVLKKLSGDPVQMKLIEEREKLANPLRNKHANIIETYFEHNSAGQLFIVERLLPDVLNDQSNSHGTERAGQLLFDIASAVAYLHARELVHGDIKPDNIGVDEGRYILLDFGICRPPDQFTGGTGSLRTQSPELLLGTGTNSYSSDLWALGATVLNYLGPGFPLFEEDEEPPKQGPARTEFRDTLIQRAKRAGELVPGKLAEVEDPRLRGILERMLAVNSSERPMADAIILEMQTRLPHIVGGRGVEGRGPRLDAQQHAVLIINNFPPKETIAYLPPNRRDKLREATRKLLEQLAPDDALRQRLAELLNLLGPPS